MAIPHPPSHTPLQPLPSAATGAASRARAEQRGARRREVDLAAGGGGVSTARCCGQSTAAAGPRLGGGGARSATDLMAKQRASDGFGGARRQRRVRLAAARRGLAAEPESERRNRSCDFLLKQRECLLPLDVNQRHPQPLQQRSRIFHYGRRYESFSLSLFLPHIRIYIVEFLNAWKMT
jgi:hypothetical protein